MMMNKKEMLKLIDKTEIKLEYILESDPRTMSNRECKNSNLFDAVYEALKTLRQVELFIESDK